MLNFLDLRIAVFVAEKYSESVLNSKKFFDCSISNAERQRIKCNLFNRRYLSLDVYLFMWWKNVIRFLSSRGHCDSSEVYLTISTLTQDEMINLFFSLLMVDGCEEAKKCISKVPCRRLMNDGSIEHFLITFWVKLKVRGATSYNWWRFYVSR